MATAGDKLIPGIAQGVVYSPSQIQLQGVMIMSFERKITRRRALQIAGAAVAPMFIPARLLGDNAPSKQIVMGFIGVGWMGGDNLTAFLGQKDCKVVAIADVDQRHLNP